MHMKLCEKKPYYKCGIFVSTQYKKEIVLNVIKNMLSLNGYLINNQYAPEVKYNNDSRIKIILNSDNARGYRLDGLIVDYVIDKDIVNNCILPTLHSQALNLLDTRIDVCKINNDDVLDAALKPYINNEEEFRKEYNCMFYTTSNNDFDRPIITKELNKDKVMLFEAWGIPKNLIKYSVDFINKTKETFLNITGSYRIDDIGFENDLNVHIPVDTDIYDGYEVNIEDGMVTVILHEIKNEAPVLKDCTVVNK